MTLPGPSATSVTLAGRTPPDEWQGEGIDRAWSYEPRRFWLHTCTLDHPAALPNYLKAGFVLFRQETIRREL